MSSDVRKAAAKQVSFQDLKRAELNAKADARIENAGQDVKAAGEAIKAAGNDSADVFAYALGGVYGVGAAVVNVGQGGVDVAKGTIDGTEGVVDVFAASLVTTVAGGAAVVELGRDGLYSAHKSAADHATKRANRILQDKMGYDIAAVSTEKAPAPGHVRASDALIAVSNELIADAQVQFNSAAANYKASVEDFQEAGEYALGAATAPIFIVGETLSAAGNLAVAAADTGKAGANVVAAYGVRLASFAVEAQKQGLLTAAEAQILRAEVHNKLANVVKNSDRNELGLTVVDMTEINQFSAQLETMISQNQNPAALRAIANEKQVLPQQKAQKAA
jgi:hypothetical protein